MLNHYVAAFSYLEKFNYRAKLLGGTPDCSESVPTNAKSGHMIGPVVHGIFAPR